LNQKKTKGPNRHQARESAIETLYAWHSGGGDNADLPHLLAGRIQEEERGTQDENYLREMVYGVTEQKEELHGDHNRTARPTAGRDRTVLAGGRTTPLGGPGAC